MAIKTIMNMKLTKIQKNNEYLKIKQVYKEIKIKTKMSYHI